MKATVALQKTARWKNYHRRVGSSRTYKSKNRRKLPFGMNYCAAAPEIRDQLDTRRAIMGRIIRLCKQMGMPGVGTDLALFLMDLQLAHLEKGVVPIGKRLSSKNLVKHLPCRSRLLGTKEARRHRAWAYVRLGRRIGVLESGRGWVKFIRPTWRAQLSPASWKQRTKKGGDISAKSAEKSNLTDNRISRISPVGPIQKKQDSRRERWARGPSGRFAKKIIPPAAGERGIVAASAEYGGHSHNLRKPPPPTQPKRKPLTTYLGDFARFSMSRWRDERLIRRQHWPDDWALYKSFSFILPAGGSAG